MGPPPPQHDGNGSKYFYFHLCPSIKYLIITVILGLRSIAKKTVENKQTVFFFFLNSNTHIQFYIRLDTLEEKLSRQGAWATSGGSLFQALMVRGKKVFDL